MTITIAHVMKYHVQVSTEMTFWYARMNRMMLYVLTMKWLKWKLLQMIILAFMRYIIASAGIQTHPLGLQPIVSIWRIYEITHFRQLKYYGAEW